MKLKLSDAGLIVFVLLFIGMVVFIRVDEKKARKGKRVVGNISRKSRSKYDVYFTYEYQDKVYTSSTVKMYLFDYIKLGEMFEVSVDTANPKNAIIYFDKPVMDVNKPICKTSAKVKVDGNLNSDLVEFVYAVGDKWYKRKQMATADDRDQYEDKFFLVKYYCDDPSIGFVFLDSISNTRTN